jgi:acyl-CoA reductase-like NAD-dependent aldehyde dehydrogenase
MSQAAAKLTPPAATARPELDAALANLRKHATEWARSPVEERIALARRMLDGYVAVAEDQVRAGCRAKGIEFDSPASGEEWLAGPSVVIRNLRLLLDTLGRIARGEPAIDPSRVRTRADGRVIVDVFPPSGLDKLMFAGFTGEVWMQPGTKAEDVPKQAAAHYKTPVDKREGRVCLVLGAGNVASIPPMDVIYKMFVEGKVCLLKMNPVNAHVGPFVERAFKDAIDRGLCAVAYGGGDVGSYLCEHAEVDEIHITGSDKTHDLIIWGPPGPEREARKKRKEPVNKKEITSELGNVSPVIVVPGPYSDAEFAWQGDSIGAAIANNASFNCNSAKLLVQSRGWDGREKLRRAVAASLARTPVRKAYYPGAETRWKELTDAHEHVERIGDAGPGTLPWAIISDVDPEKRDDKSFHVEPWCSILSETALPVTEPVAFLEAAVKFVNERVWGTLSATIVVHPKTAADPKVAAALERAIGELRYGAVAINHWPALAYAFCSTPWGGHPSSTLEDIQSGRGWVHNTFMLEGIEKAVVRGPITVKPTPLWFPNHKTAHHVGRRLVRFEAAPSVWKLPGMIWNAMRG